MKKKISIAALIVASAMMMNEKTMAMTERKIYSPEKLSGNTIRINSENKITEGIPGEVVLTKNDTVFGGRSEDMSQDANDNHIFIEKIPEMKFYAVGGYGKNAKNNSIELETGMMGYMVEAGRAKELAEGNKIILKNITNLSGGNLIAGHVLGAAEKVGGEAPKIARNNEIHITAAKDFQMSGYHYGGQADDVVEGNKVFIQGVEGLSLSYITIGGGDVYDQDDKGLAKDNLVFIKKAILGGRATSIIGGAGIKSLGNEVILWDVLARSGASVVPGALPANRFYMTENFEVGNNSIRLVGTTDVGAAELKATSHFNPEFVKSAKTYGNFLNFGYIDKDGAHAWESSNEKGNFVNKASVESFQKLKFTAVKWDPERAALVTEEGADLSKMKVNAKGMVFTNLEEMEKAFKENPEGKMYLIDATSTGDLALQDKNISYDKTYTIGTTLEGTATATVVKEGEHEGDLLYTLKDVKEAKIKDQTHNAVIGQEGGAILVNEGQNLIENGIDTKISDGLEGMTFYATSTGGTEKYETGSHIKTNTWNSIIGLGNVMNVDGGDFGYMTFFEYGQGDYKVHNEEGREGKGDISYQGLALAAKYKFHSDFYTEGSVRLGQMKNDAKDVLTDGTGKGYDYKTSGLYYGGHFGVGKVVELDNSLVLDSYGKFIYSHVAKDDFNAGGEYELDAVESKILKAGAKLSKKIDKVKVYLGLSVEHEFDGKATGTADKKEIKAAKIDGTSGVGEIGVKLMPSPESAWEFDVSARGYTGQHKGVRGNVGVTYKF